MRRLALLVAAAVVLVATLFLGSELIPVCLGPLGVTGVECLSAYIQEHPEFSPGPGRFLAPALAVSFGLVLATVLPRRGITVRWLVPLVATGITGGAAGAAHYTLARERSIEGLTSYGEWIVVPLGPNADARNVEIVVGAGVALVLVALLASWRSRLRRDPDLAKGAPDGTLAG